MGCNCGKPKCDGHCGISPAVLQINNPSECVLFHKVEIPASMGNEVTIPPEPGKYKNVLLYYEATGNAYFYSSDGIPTLLSYTDYLRLLNKPSINGVTLVGDKSLEEIGVNDATLTVKQGDATLGTFSANASEDVEINIPESSGEPAHLTVTYDTSGVWSRYADGADVNFDYSNMTGHRIYGFTVPSPTFHNEETGVDMTTEEVYNGLKNGEKFIFDGLPVGLFYDNNAPLGQEVTVTENWQSLTMDNYATCNIEGAPLVDEFSGVLSAHGVFGHNAIFSLALGYGIVHTKNNDNDVYSLVVDGVEYFGGFN